MKKNPSLPLLIDLARNHSDKARRQLQLLLANVNQGQRKLGTLESFLTEYQQRMLNSTAEGIDIGALQNYRLFLSKLSQAVTQQSDEIDTLHGKVDSAKKHWQIQERRRLSFETLQQRFDQQREKDEAQQLQKLMDAFATQRAASKIMGRK